jgi:hypothetical protein
MDNTIEKLIDIINNFFGCDAAYYDVNPFDLATHLKAHGVYISEPCNAAPSEDWRRTNSDCIRTMSDHELALQLVQYRDDWGDYCTHKGCYATLPKALEAEIEWLQEPVINDV